MGFISTSISLSHSLNNIPHARRRKIRSNRKIRNRFSEARLKKLRKKWSASIFIPFLRLIPPIIMGKWQKSLWKIASMSGVGREGGMRTIFRKIKLIKHSTMTLKMSWFVRIFKWGFPFVLRCELRWKLKPKRCSGQLKKFESLFTERAELDAISQSESQSQSLF